MEEKPARFCLQFNTDDPVQKKAYEIIAGQGRKKSAFISRAVMFYTENGGGTEALPENREELKKIVREMITEMLGERDDLPAPAEDRGQDDGNIAELLLEGLDAFDAV